MAPEPETAEGILADDYQETYEDGVGDAQFVVAGEAVATEDETADDGLQQIVGEAHAAEGAQVTEHTADTFEGIPCRDHCRHNHQEDGKVVDGLEPTFQFPEVHETK